MDYKLIINEDALPVTVTPGDTDAMANTAEAVIAIADTRYDVSAMRVDENHLHLVINGRGMNVYVADEDAGKAIMVNGVLMQVADDDTAGRLRKGRRNGKRGPQEVTPLTPAVVTSVLVAPGDRVAEGQGVVVVSAMKMETTLVAPYDGVVAAVNTAAGENVNPGDILVAIDRDAAVEGEGDDNDG